MAKKGDVCRTTASNALKSPVYCAIQEMNNEAETKMAIQPEYEAKVNEGQVRSWIKTERIPLKMLVPVVLAFFFYFFTWRSPIASYTVRDYTSITTHSQTNTADQNYMKEWALIKKEINRTNAKKDGKTETPSLVENVFSVF